MLKENCYCWVKCICVAYSCQLPQLSYIYLCFPYKKVMSFTQLYLNKEWDGEWMEFSSCASCFHCTWVVWENYGSFLCPINIDQSLKVRFRWYQTDLCCVSVKSNQLYLTKIFVEQIYLLNNKNITNYTIGCFDVSYWKILIWDVIHMK